MKDFLKKDLGEFWTSRELILLITRQIVKHSASKPNLVPYFLHFGQISDTKLNIKERFSNSQIYFPSYLHFLLTFRSGNFFILVQWIRKTKSFLFHSAVCLLSTFDLLNMKKRRMKKHWSSVCNVYVYFCIHHHVTRQVRKGCKIPRLTFFHLDYTGLAICFSTNIKYLKSIK